MNSIRERKHRLPQEYYVGVKVISFTKCIQDRSPAFTNDSTFHYFESVLKKELSQFDCDALVYLFMPDHCHLVLRGATDDSDCLNAIYRFSQNTGYWLTKHLSHITWQKDFYDHILRKDEDVEKHIRYVLDNPVRAKLVTDWRDYPFKGSTVYNFEEW